MGNNIARVYSSYFHRPLYVLFTLLSVEMYKEEIRKAIPEDAKVLVFEIEGVLFGTKNPVFELERVEARKLYKEHASIKSPETLADAYKKHLSVTNFSLKSVRSPRKSIIKKKKRLDMKNI